MTAAARRLILAAALAAPLSACGVATTGGLVAGEPEPSGDIVGAHVYRAHCSSCHALPDLGSRSRAEWETVLPRMADRAHLDSDDRQALFGFVLGTPATPARASIAAPAAL